MTRDGSSEGNLRRTSGTSTSRRRREAAAAALEASKLRANLSSCKYESVREVTKKHGYEEVDDEYEHCGPELDGPQRQRASRVEDAPVSTRESASRDDGDLPQSRVEPPPEENEIRLPRRNVRLRTRHLGAPQRDGSVPQALQGASGYIVKPTAGAMGDGVTRERSAATRIDHKHESAVVVQKYVSSPLLVDGYKFDLRIYALVTCVDPLRVDCTRRAVSVRRTPSSPACTSRNRQLRRAKTMHLTNYSLNKHSADFVRHRRRTTRARSARSRTLWKDLRAKGTPSTRCGARSVRVGGEDHRAHPAAARRRATARRRAPGRARRATVAPRRAKAVSVRR